MMYIAKPSFYNNNGMKEFSDAVSAIEYLNKQLTDKGVDPKFDYAFVAPSTAKHHLKHAIEEYIGIGKLIIKE